MIVYMISDGKGTYIRKDFAGKYSPVRNEALGDTWEQRSKAKNVLENQLNKNIRNRYRIVEIEIPDVKKIANNIETVSKHSTETAKQISNEEIEDDQIGKWESGIDSLSTFVHDLEERKENLNNKLSDVDKEIIDIQHYIEFGGKFNAYEGWLAFSMLRHRLNNEVCGSDDGYWMASFDKCEIAECTYITMNERVRICFKDDIEEIKNYFYQQVADNDEIEPAEKIKIVSEKLQALEWTKIIIVYLELPE